jgi:hypothetical protein
MAFNVNTILAQLKKDGLARSNKFDVLCPIPTGLIQSNPDSLNTGRTLNLYAESTATPGSTLTMDSVRRYGYGPIENKPVNVTFEPIPLTFRGDSKLKVFEFMHAWHQSIVPCMTGGINDRAAGSTLYPYELAYKADYVVDLALTLYEDTGDPSITFHLREAYPVAVAETPLAWASKSEYVRIPTVFTFLDFRITRAAPTP